MTKFLVITMTVCGISLLSCSSSKNAASGASSAINGTYLQRADMNGASNEWAGVPAALSPSGAIEYAIANSHDQIYIRLKVADPLEQMKLLSEGLHLFISPYGKSDRSTSIMYPVKGELNQTELYAQPESGDKLNRETIHRRIGIQLVSINRTGFRPEYNGVQSIRENTGFKAALAWDASDNLIYELAFPLKALPFTVNNNSLELQFQVDALERPAERAGSAGNENGWSGGGMGRRGGGYGGRRPGNYNQAGQGGPGRRQSQKAFENEAFATEYHLASGG